MLNANVEILKDLRSFLSLVSTNINLTRLFSHSREAFTRTRKLPFDKLILMISRLNKKSLSVELEDFFEDLGETGSCSTSAFCQQRNKLLPSFFKYWNAVLWMNYYQWCAKSAKRWKGYRLIAADGSGVSLVKTPSLEKYFGGQRNQQSSFVQGRSFFCYDLLNEMILYSRLCPYRYGELNMAYKAMDLYREDMLVIYDRNFCCYKMVALHQFKEKEVKFVIRAKESQRMIKDFIDKGIESDEVFMEPGVAAIEALKKSGFIVHKHTRLKVRLVRVQLKDKVEVLLTNLWKTEGHTTDGFKELYNKRWGIETNIGFQKNVMQLESFSGLTPNSVLQDFYATVFIANLYSVLKKSAQHVIRRNKQGKYPLQINNNKAFGKMKQYITRLFTTKRIKNILQELKCYFIRHPLPIRKGRSYKRERKNRMSLSKFKTFTNFKPAY